jgi:hypothetical protein
MIQALRSNGRPYKNSDPGAKPQITNCAWLFVPSTVKPRSSGSLKRSRTEGVSTAKWGANGGVVLHALAAGNAICSRASWLGLWWSTELLGWLSIVMTRPVIATAILANEATSMRGRGRWGGSPIFGPAVETFAFKCEVCHRCGP